MPRQRKSTTPVISVSLDDRSVRWATEDSHPSQVSGLLKRDPTFQEFRKLLHQQRQEDYQQAREAPVAILRKKRKTTRCLSSTPIVICSHVAS